MPIFDAPLDQGDNLSDRYAVVSFLGKGSAGHVYRVYDRHLGKDVALKVLMPVKGQPATWDEAQLLERLRSEYLLPVFNADTLPIIDLRYITMPVMSGGDLRDRADKYGVSISRGVSWGVRIATGLSRIHDAGLVHRDVKPENVYLTATDDVVLGDLGLAMRLDADGRCASAGTPVTAAPELTRPAGRCTVSSDVFSLAATVFFLLSGQYPVNNLGSGEDVLRRVAAGEFRRLRDFAPHVSQGLALVVERGLSVEPTGRQRTAIQFANQLASARRHVRDWERLRSHEEHGFCVEGSGVRSRKGVNVCIVGGDKPNRFDVEVLQQSGRHIRKHERRALRWEEALVAVREITKVA